MTNIGKPYFLILMGGVILWHTKFQMNASCAELVQTVVPLALSQRVTASTLSTLISASTAELVQVLVLLALLLKHNLI